MKQSWFFSFLLLAVSNGIAEDANYDEAKVPAYTLPELLEFEDGAPVETAEDWSKRREELLGLFAEHVYGITPQKAKATKLNAEVTREVSDFLKGKASMKEVRLSFPGLKEGPSLKLLIVAPKSASKAPVPAFLGLNFRGNHTIHPDPRITLSEAWMRPDKEGRVIDHKATEKSRGAAASRWPLETIIDRGYALAVMYYGDIDPDFDDDFENGVHGVFGKPKGSEWGSIGTWVWGLSRALDYLEVDERIDGAKVSVIGHSRLGKTSLWAGATDERFAFAISNDSGCGGAALNRRAYGETVKRINTVFPHWFNDRYPEYNDKLAALPVDQHQLIALMAPRPVYVASAIEDQSAGAPWRISLREIRESAWKLFGKTGVGVEEMPAVDQAVGDHVGYHVRTGKHDVTDYDWARYLDFADRLVK